jgi:type I restriction enzyme S subunit
MEFATRTLGEICDEVDGVIQTGPFGSQLHQSDYRDEGTPVVMPKDLAGDRVSVESIARIGDEDVERLARHKLETGDIVYARRGDIGRRALITGREAGWMCGTGCMRISLGDTILNPRFLFYYLGQPDIVTWIYNQAVGATMPNLNTSIVRSVPVKYPPLPSQHKIAAVLSAYDDLIENNTRRIAVLEEMARMLHQEWFVRFRFPGHEDVAVADSELGPVPEGWEVKPLGEVCDLVIGQSPKSEFYNEEGNGLPFHQGVTDFGRLYPTTRVYCTVTKRVAEPGDILFSVRAPVGRINIADRKIVIGRGLHAIRSKAGNQTFILLQLKDKFHEEDIMGSGTIFKAVTKSDMLGLPLLIPSPDLITKFEQIVVPMFSTLGILTKKNAILRRTRDLLLPRLVSGEVDVSNMPIAVTRYLD